MCKKFETGQPHDAASCHDRHDLIDFKGVEDLLLYNHSGNDLPAVRWCIRFAYSLSADAGFVWEIVDEVTDCPIVTESHDLATALNALLEYLDSNKSMGNTLSKLPVSLSVFAVRDTSDIISAVFSQSMFHRSTRLLEAARRAL